MSKSKRPKPHRRSAAKPTTRHPRYQDKIVFGGCLVLLFVVCLLCTYAHAFYNAMPFGDTATYLDVGRNYFEGHGFIARFNIQQYWVGGTNTHPGLSYYNPLYCLILGALYHWLNHDPASLSVMATAIPACFNAVLLAVLVRPMLGMMWAILCGLGYVLLPTSWWNIALLSAEHPTITILLLTALVIDRLVSKRSTYWLLAGVIVGVGFLVKVTVALAGPGLVVAILWMEHGTLRERLVKSIRPVVLLSAGVASIILPFTLYCRLSVGEFYPSYPAMAKNWVLATYYGGTYVAESPAVRYDVNNYPTPIHRIRIATGNLGHMLANTAIDLSALVLFVSYALIRMEHGRRNLTILLMCIGAAFAIGYPLSFNFVSLSTDPGSTRRYGLYVAAFWYPLGIVALAQVIKDRTALDNLRTRLASIGIWLLISTPAIVEKIDDHVLAASRTRAIPSRQWQRMMKNVAALVGPDDLVAVAPGGYEVSCAAFLDRVTVTMPQGRMDNAAAFREFVKAYNPVLMLPNRGRTRAAYEVAPDMGYVQTDVPSFRRKVFIRGDKIAQ